MVSPTISVPKDKYDMQEKQRCMTSAGSLLASKSKNMYCGKNTAIIRLLVSTAGRALVCCAGGRGFKSRPQKQSGSLNYWEASDAFVMTSANGYTFLRILGCKDENPLVPFHSTFTYLVRVRVRNVDPNPNLPWALWVICKERYRSCNLMILFQESKWLPVDIQCMYV